MAGQQRVRPRVEETERGIVVRADGRTLLVPWAAVEFVVYYDNGDMRIFTRFSRIDVRGGEFTVIEAPVHVVQP